mmetsp:Transcript_15360/g.58070  ORF Transcript_15360/g.58070 Transcript_15360/m.58070 type:complete len:338 (-) Transcript_15360:217-1230(-)
MQGCPSTPNSFPCPRCWTPGRWTSLACPATTASTRRSACSTSPARRRWSLPSHTGRRKCPSSPGVCPTCCGRTGSGLTSTLSGISPAPGPRRSAQRTTSCSTTRVAAGSPAPLPSTRSRRTLPGRPSGSGSTTPGRSTRKCSAARPPTGRLSTGTSVPLPAMLRPPKASAAKIPSSPSRSRSTTEASPTMATRRTLPSRTSSSSTLPPSAASIAASGKLALWPSPTTTAVATSSQWCAGESGTSFRRPASAPTTTFSSPERLLVTPRPTGGTRPTTSRRLPVPRRSRLSSSRETPSMCPPCGFTFRSAWTPTFSATPGQGRHRRAPRTLQNAVSACG